MMMNKNIIKVMLLVAVALFVSVIYSVLEHQKQFSIQQKKQMTLLAHSVSKIQFIIQKHHWEKVDSYHSLIDQLHPYPEIALWALFDDKGVELDGGGFNQATNGNNRDLSLLEVPFLLPTNSISETNQTLMITFQFLAVQNNMMTPSLFFVMLFCMLIIGFYLNHQFAWVKKLEEYSKHVLVSNTNQALNMPSSSHNIIGNAINQLILNNTHLIKAKSDLAEQIRTTSYVDEVTNLGNQLFFKAELEVRLHNHGEAESGLVIILSFIDEETKEEKPLTSEQQKQIANLLKQALSDINHSLVARLKDSEFVLLIPNYTADKIDQFCKKLIKKLSKTIFNDTLEHSHFVDVGVSSYKQGFNYYHVMAEADMALRNAQLQGANSWFVYGESLSKSKTKGRLRWQSFLQNVLDKREIQLFSQNIYYLSDNDKQAASKQHKEVLLKIPDGKDILSASTFIAMASHCGLASEFDRQVIDNVIKHILYQKEQNIKVIYTVNIFASSLLDEKFTSWLVAKLSSYPKLNQSIIFELSESSLSKNIDEVAAIMQQLYGLGVKWSVDHFGSPEDLSYLSKAPISMIKIDRRIIHNIASSSVHQLLLSSIIASSKTYKIKVYAEGIEKQADADYLKSTDIEALQGYFYDHPQKLTVPTAITD